MKMSVLKKTILLSLWLHVNTISLVTNIPMEVHQGAR